MKAKDVMLSGDYLILSKGLLLELGVKTTVFLSSLAEADKLLSNKDGWFFQTVDDVEKRTTLTRYQQEQCISILKDKKILEQKNMGVPMKRHFRLNVEAITSIQKEKNSQTRKRKTSELDREKLPNLEDGNSRTRKGIANELERELPTDYYKELNKEINKEHHREMRVDKYFQELIDLSQQIERGRPDLIVQRLDYFTSVFPHKWIVDALNKTIKNGGNSLNYTEKILKGMQANGPSEKKKKKKYEGPAGVKTDLSVLGKRKESII